jgi:hypothetical protein
VIGNVFDAAVASRYVGAAVVSRAQD